MKTFGNFEIKIDVDGLCADEGCQKIQDAANGFTGFDVHIGPHYSRGGWKETAEGKQYIQPQPLGIHVSGRLFGKPGYAGVSIEGDVEAEHVPLNADEKWGGIAVVKGYWGNRSTGN